MDRVSRLAAGAGLLYLQIELALKEQIILGDIKEGGRTPSVRELSKRYSINPMTASKALQNLAAGDYIEYRRGKGMYVRPGVQNRLKSEGRAAFINEELPQILKKMSLYDFPHEAFIKSIGDLKTR